VEAYTVSSNSWATVASYPVYAGLVKAAVFGNYIYTAGVIASGMDTTKTYRYDPSSNSWDDASIADLPATRRGAGSAVLNGKWILAGGIVNDVSSSSVLVWDPTSNNWSNIDPMLQARHYVGAGVLTTGAGTAMYEVGGYVVGTGWTGSTDNQRYQCSAGAPPPSSTPTRTPTGRPVSTPTSTITPSTPSTLIGHVVWQGRPTQPSTFQVLPITLTVRMSSGSYHDYSASTDQSGFFTVTVSGLPAGTYNWRVKGPQFLASSGSMLLAAGATRSEMGMQMTGDVNNDNCDLLADFNILKNVFGMSVRDPGYDARSDLTGDSTITLSDFNLLKGNFGACGTAPL